LCFYALIYSLKPSEFFLQYEDEEGDRVVIASNEEMKEALVCHQQRLAKIPTETGPSRPPESPQLESPQPANSGNVFQNSARKNDSEKASSSTTPTSRALLSPSFTHYQHSHHLVSESKHAKESPYQSSQIRLRRLREIAEKFRINSATVTTLARVGLSDSDLPYLSSYDFR
jgi:hypothetical protein